MASLSLTARTADAALLLQRTVANHGVIDHIADRLAGFARDPRRPAHTSVVGGLGSGKTHTLIVALEQARTLWAFRTRVSWVWAGGIGVTTYTDLLWEIAAGLGAPDLGQMPSESKSNQETPDRRAEAEAAIREAAAGSPIVVVLENLDVTLEQLPVNDLADFNALLLGNAPGVESPVLLLGSSPTAVSNLKKIPTLNELQLEPLTDGQAVRLILGADAYGVEPAALGPSITLELDSALGKFDRHVRGNPRFCALVASYLNEGHTLAVARAIDAWRSLLDVYYPERLRVLAPGERRLVVALARAGRPQTVKSLSDLVGASDRTAASALRRLFDAGWVAAAKPAAGADLRLTWYEVTDPLLRSHFEWYDGTGPTALVREVLDRWQPEEVAQATGVEDRALLADLEKRSSALGASGNPGYARDLMRAALVRRIELDGLTSDATIRTLHQYASWYAEAGDAEQGVRIFTAAIPGIEKLKGKKSREALMLYQAVGWWLMQLGRPAEALRVLGKVIERASVTASNIDLVLQAEQDTARAIGEQEISKGATPTGAVAAFQAVLAKRRKLLPDDAETIRTCMHGLAWWKGMAGRPSEAVADLDALAADASASPYHRFSYQKDAAHWAAQISPREAMDRNLSFADEMEKHYSMASEPLPHLASVGRQEALRCFLVEDEVELAAAPVANVVPTILAELLGQALLDHQWPVSALGDLRPSLTDAQIEALAVWLALYSKPLRPGLRASAVTTLGRWATSPNGPLIVDLGKALAGDPKISLGMPSEWRPIIDDLRHRDGTAI